MSELTPDDAFLEGGGEMGALVRRLDWSTSPLGPPRAWPQSLRTAVSLCLMSRFPMAVAWGPSYALVYNDAYRPILGTKHPWAMGRPCFDVWSELAHIVQPMFDGVIDTGQATWSDDLALPMMRHGYLEEAYFTVSYSAIRGESGKPDGILVTVTETTERYLAERRLRLVRELGEAAGASRSVSEVVESTQSILTRHAADVPFALLYTIEADGSAHLAAATGVAQGSGAAPPRIEIAGPSASWPLRDALDGSRQHLVCAVPASWGPLPGGLWPESPAEAVVLPVSGPGGRPPVAALVAGVNPRRALDAQYLAFFELVARQIANAMANAAAHEEARHRAETLAELDRAKTAFLSNVSHEFRTPLTLMLGPLQHLIDAAPALGSADRERLDMAHRNALRLLKLVNSLLDFASIEAGRMEASFEPTDVPALTADVASVFRSAIERAGVEFVVSSTPVADPVLVDRAMWEKVVLNLLSNAFKFTFTGRIQVTVGQIGSRVELAVSDTGTGIPESELPHLFERFHHARDARGRSFEGAGIGLALVHELVKVHGGTVRAESSRGIGSTFLVSIPVGSSHLPADRIRKGDGAEPGIGYGGAAVAEALRWLPAGSGATDTSGFADAVSLRLGQGSDDRSRITADRPTGSADGDSVHADRPRPAGHPRRARVLVADDNADMRGYLLNLLGDRYDVEQASDGLQALRMIRERPPDVLVTDVMMPGLDGFELLASLRAGSATRDLPVLMLSARAGEDARVEGLRAGADDYLVKPFGANELTARVGSIVQLAQFRRESEERLAQANRELNRRVMEQQALLDVLPIGIGIATDPECRNIRVNRAFAATLGLSPGANASKTAPAGERPTNFRVVTPNGVEVPDDELPMQVAARDGRSVSGVEYDILHADGRIVRLLEYATPLLDEHGRPRGAIGAFVDVSAHLEAQRTLTRSEERYRRIFDAAGVSLWEEDFTDVTRELDGLLAAGVTDLEQYFAHHPDFVDRCIGLVKLVDVNDATVRMFGAADKASLLRSLHDVFEPDTHAVFAGELRAIARGERSYEAETALRTLDGRRIHALMTMTFPPPGEPFTSVLVSLADITDRKLAETALQQEVAVRSTLARVGASLAGELHAEPLVQAVTDAATALTSAEFGAFFHNVTGEAGDSYALYSLSGASREAFSAFPHPRATALFGPTFRGEAIIRLDDVAADPRYGMTEPFHGMPHGHLPVRSYLAVPVIARGGQVLGGLFFGHSQAGVFTDRHEQLASGVASWAAIALDNARLYQDLEFANRLKDEFLATLSHELRTPLNAVLGWAHMLREGTMKPSMQQRALESLERNALAQARLVEDLLDVSRIMSGKLHIKAEPVDMVTVVRNAIETIRAGATAKRLALDLQLADGDPILVTGDPDRMQQIVWNLVSNAIKFTPSGGRVEVSLRQVDAHAELVVRDTGEGIDPSFRPYLFERFRQMDASTSRRHGGLGLGLSIVRHLTEAHGGKVSGESAGPGLGSTFRVTLPVRPAVLSGHAALSPGAPFAIAGVRALVVDDEPDARDLVRYVLESRGAHVTTAASAGEALHFIRERAFDVLVADIGMPEQDGYSLIRVIRDMPGDSVRSMGAVAVTAYASVHERNRALEAGYDWHLAKPVDPEQLVAAVAAAARPWSDDRTPRSGRSPRPGRARPAES
jgi:signal transduction histidine kinase/DNA-binding response OmpR family regulator